jgi:hypothetical protein
MNPVAKPVPSIVYGRTLGMDAYPGVSFLVSDHSVSGDWEVTSVQVAGHVIDPEYVLAALVAMGRTFRLTAQMRAAYKVWKRDVWPARMADVARCELIAARDAERLQASA